MNKEYTFTYFLISFIILNIIDALTTYSILLLGGIEVNPLPLFVIENYGTRGFFFFKTIAPIALGLMCFRKNEIWDFLLVLFATICSWNSIVLVTFIVRLLRLH